MDEEGAMLGVGFAIDFHDSFGQLKSLDDLIGTVQANAVREFQKLEAASNGALNLAGPTAQITSFGNAATRELATAAREFSRVEKSGEALVRQLDRQNAAFGKTREELRMMKAEAAAAAAEEKGLTDLAGRIRSTAADLAGRELAAARRARFAAEELAEARAATEAAAAQKATLDRVQAERALNSQLAERSQLEAAIGRNTGVGRSKATDSGATFSALAAKAADDEARAATSAAAAQKRLATEHERLAAAVQQSHAAQMADAVAAERLRQTTDPLYAATKRLHAEIAESTRLYHAGATAPAEYARQQGVLQERLQGTVASHKSMDQSMKRGSGTLTQLSFQLNDVATMAASGAGAFQIFATQAGQIFQVAQMAEGGVKGFLGEVGGVAARFAPALAVLAVAGGAFALFQRSMVDGTDPKDLTKNLGLTKAEIAQLKDVGIDTSDVLKATFQVLAEQAGISFKGMGKAWSGVLDWMTGVARSAMANIYANSVGTFKAVYAAVVALKDGKGVSGAWNAAAGAYTGAQAEANKYLKDTGADIRARALKNEREQLAKQAAAIKADRTPKKPKTDSRAETLAREVAGTEALIKGLYESAKAFDISTAAGIRARVEAEAREKGLKKEADLLSYVGLQLRKYVAERVQGAAEQTAAMADQTRAQEFVNQAVRAGQLDAAKASQALTDMAEQQKLMTTMSVAAPNNDKQGYDAAKKALEGLTAAQLASNKARVDAADLQQQAQATRSIQDVELETRLMKDLGAARIKALQGSSGATLDDELASIAAQHEKIAIQAKAELEAQRNLVLGYDDAAAAILRRAEADKSQVDAKRVIDQQTTAQQRYNDELRDSIDLLGSMGKLGQGLGALLGIVSGNTGAVRGPLGDLLNTSFDTGKTDKSGAKIASTIGDEVSKVFGKGGKFGEGMKSALQGAGVGMSAAEAVFGKQSTVQKLGSAIGGMAGKTLGTAIAGPLGGAIGSIAGGLLGSVVSGLFTKVKWGRVDLSSSGVSAASGNSGAAEKAALAAGKSVFGSLTNLATQLGGAIGDFGNISVGTRHGDYRVNTGGTSLKVKKGAIDFDDDAEAAVAYAIKQAIEKGAITGIRDSTNNLLKAGDDLQAQLQNAMSFEGVFADLKGYTDPVGAALDTVNKQFDQLRVIFKEAGASAEEYASLEQLLTIKRQEAMRKESDALDDVKSRIAEAQGDTATVKAIERAHELRDALNDNVRAELQHLYAVEDSVAAQQELTDAQKTAAAAADELREAWKSIGTDLFDEINRIRGITDGTAPGGFATLQGQFNAAVTAASGGDKEAAGKLVELSQSLLAVAGNTATSRQELDRIKAQTAASLEGVYGLVGTITGGAAASPSSFLTAAATATSAATPQVAANDQSTGLREIRDELRQMRGDMIDGLAANASANNRTAKTLENVTPDGDAIKIANAA